MRLDTLLTLLMVGFIAGIRVTSGVEVYSIQPELAAPRDDVYIQYDFGQNSSQNSGVEVYSIQPELAAPRDDVYIQYDFGQNSSQNDGIPQVLENFTICYHLQRTSMEVNEMHFSYALPDNGNGAETNALLFWVKDTYDIGLFIHGDFLMEEKENIDEVLVSIAPYTWFLFCHVFDDDYTLYVNGNKVLKKYIRDKLETMEMNGLLVIGQDQDEYGGGFSKIESFRGYYEYFNIWSRALSESTVKSMVYDGIQDHGDIFSTETSSLELFNVMKVNISLENLDFIYIPYGYTYDGASHRCQLIGSHLFYPRTKKQMTDMMKETRKHKDSKYDSIRLGVKYINGSWFEDYTNEIVSVNISEATVEHLKCAQVNFYAPKKIVLAKCDRKLTFACKRYSDRYLTLRGICSEKLSETLFVPRTTPNGDLVLQGLYDYYVSFDKLTEKWVISDFKANKSIAQTIKSGMTHGMFYPVGRQQWSLLSPCCGKEINDTFELCFTSCTINQFTCNNGDCITISKRCDYKADCQDLSDEVGCSILSLPSGYAKHISPTTNLSVVFNLLRFPSIGDTTNYFEVEFEIITSWFDPQITFMNLQPRQKSNQLNKTVNQSIWQPFIKFLNDVGSNTQLKSSSMEIRINGNASFVEYTDAMMNIPYEGNSAEIVYTRKYMGKFDCAFYVYYFPLDKTSCKILVTVTSGDIKISQDFVNVIYSGDNTLNAFELQNFGVIVKNQTEDDEIEVHFELVRLPENIMVVTLLPSFMIVAIGYSTLYLKNSLFQDRLTVSLSSLLVLYTLFNQTSSFLPKTSYITMIDIWFLACIVLLFIVIIFHIVVDNISNRVEKIHPTSKLSVSNTVRVVRVIVIPGISVLFLIIWTTVIVIGN